MKGKGKYILRWNQEDMTLSNGEKKMEFDSHEDALDAIEKEADATSLPLMRPDLPTSEYYRRAKLEVVLENKPGVLFAVSWDYVRPFYGDHAVPKIKFLGEWYTNVQEKYEQQEDGLQMPSLFFARSSVGEYIVYYDHIIFHTTNGFVSADRNDLSNNERV